MRINLQLPFQARNIPENAQAFHIGHFYEELATYLEDRGDIDVSYSVERRKPKHVNGAYCLNYHTRIVAERHRNVKSAYLPGFMYVDRCGYSAWSEIYDKEYRPAQRDAGKAHAFYQEQLWEPLLKHGKTKFRQPKAMSTALPQDYVFVPLQVPNDSVMQLGYFSQERLILECLNLSRDMPVVFKVHPITRKKDAHYADTIDSLHSPRDGVHVVEGHVHSLIEGARAVVCTNSGVGIEALMLGTPVVTCGRADYHHLAHVAKRPEDLRTRVEASVPLQIEDVETYAEWFFGTQLVTLRRPVDVWGADIVTRLQETALAA